LGVKAAEKKTARFFDGKKGGPPFFLLFFPPGKEGGKKNCTFFCPGGKRPPAFSSGVPEATCFYLWGRKKGRSPLFSSSSFPQGKKRSSFSLREERGLEVKKPKVVFLLREGDPKVFPSRPLYAYLHT
jgi:hypothetical protein